jgi:L-2-hydroxyglutarate oxidase LhgO
MSVAVIEKELRSGEGISSRNSGVIHAGMYYPQSSLKKKFCISGNKLLYKYAKNKNINHKKIGKYIIASKSSELKRLKDIYDQGIINGVNLELCSKDKTNSLHPELITEGSIFSPETGIIDVPELITALEGDIQHNGGLVSLNTSFLKAIQKDNIFEIQCNDGKEFAIKSKFLINSSGISSEVVAQSIEPLDSRYIYPISYARGHYFKYSGDHPFSTLVYPVSDEFTSGLHVGFDMSGQIRFGPSIDWVDDIDYSFDESLKENFISSIKSYWPSLNPDKLQPDYVGIRPKIQNANEQMKDFSILEPKDHGIRNLINIQGIESPGVTSCLSIGEYVTNLISKN